MGARQRIHRVRPYNWGAIYISDADCDEDFDVDVTDGDGPLFSSAVHIALAVLNSRTVAEGAGEVALDLRVGDRRADGLPYEVTLEVPSGRLLVGDADVEDEVALRPGRWLLQFAVDDPQEARHVDIVLSPHQLAA